MWHGGTMTEDRAPLLDAVARGDLDELIRWVDALCASRDWEGVVLLRDRCRHALEERGLQLWPAAEFADRVRAAEVRDRSARLRRLGDELGLRFRQAHRGAELDAIVLGARPGDGRVRALTGNFIEALLEPGSAERGELTRVVIERVTPQRVDARRAGRPVWAATGASSN